MAWAVVGLMAAAVFGRFFYVGSRIDGLGTGIDALAARIDALAPLTAAAATSI